MKSTAGAFAIVAALCLAPAAAHAQLGGLGKLKDKLPAAGGDKAAFADSKSIQPDACISNVEGRVRSIVETYYPNFKSKGVSYLGDGQLWFIRKDFEAAMSFYTSGARGYHARGITCDVGPAQANPRYVALKAKLDDAEAKVKEMEAAKGYAFVSCEDDTILFKELKTGKALSADESSKV
ncbi:MAG: hypothetical protein QM767_26730 [Anaeromyxobacter sp.]